MVLTSRQVPIEELLSGHPQSVQIYEDKGARRLQPEAGHVYNKQEIPYETAAASGNRLISFTQYRSAGLTLDVVVQHVTPDGLVVLDLNTNITDLTGFIRVGLNERNEPMRVPVFDSREIENRLIIPDGTVFLAGLMKTTRQSERERGLPWLSELPIIRWFTTNESRDSQDTELVFLIKPEILTHRPTMAELAETGDLP